MKFLLPLFVFILVPVNGLIGWKTLDDALKEAKENSKPVLFLMTKSTCKPCKKLGEKIEGSIEFATLSQEFNLARAIDDELPKDERFNLDGKYLPKMVFLHQNGEVLSEIVNADAKKDNAKYFYSKVEHVLKSMNATINHMSMDNGFGKEYRWYSWENGLKAAKELEKPILLVFHQDWCGACARLKPKFSSAAEVKELASSFIMINTDREDLVKGDKYKVDGEYYPKILFLDSEGELVENEWNHGTKHTHVKHYYGEGAEISASMKRVVANFSAIEKVDDKGFGKHIKWVKYETGLKMAKEKSKPMMLIIHKSYCGACKALKPRIRNSEEIGELSKQFVMVHCEDDEEPTDDQFDIDGAYIPRVFFLDNHGRVEEEIKNHEKDFKDVQYAYGSAATVVQSMKKALEMKLGERSADRKVKQKKTEKVVKKEKIEHIQTVTQDSKYKGFNSLIKWFSYEEGLREAKKSHKVSLLFFYNDYCEFSVFMKKQFHETSKIVELSRKFVMIRIGEEEGKELKRFDIDGTYTPRMIFMDPDQNIHSDVNNTDTAYPSTLFYYGDGDSIYDAMNLALEKINLTLGNGFGEYISWVRYEKSFEEAKERNMPIMLIIHKSWCGACSALKPIIHYSRPIWEMSQYFVMVNVEDDEEPVDNQYFIDGGYYPRIFFLDSAGKVDPSLHNRDPAFLKYKFSYSKEDQILMAMRFAAAKLRDSSAMTTESMESTETTETVEESTTETETSEVDDSNLSMGKKLLKKSGAEFLPVDDALVKAKKVNKPILLIIHRTTCPACKALLKLISRDKDFKNKAAPFVLADVEDDVDEKKANSFNIDGGYVPRVYYLDPQGEVIRDIWNVGTNYIESKYYYYDTTSLYKSMAKAVLYLKNLEEEKIEKATGNSGNKKDEL